MKTKFTYSTDMKQGTWDTEEKECVFVVYAEIATYLKHKISLPRS